MRKSKVILFSAVLLMGLPGAFSAMAYSEPAPAAPQSNGSTSYELKQFYADYKPFAIGDVVPDLYRTREYRIDAWQIRHLPAPEAGSYWTYMGGNYVLITETEGKIVRAVKGDIFYSR